MDIFKKGQKGFKCTPNTPEEIVEILLKNIKISETGCWEYQGKLKDDGYVSCSYRRRIQNGHRLVYQVCISPIRENMCICHRCDNRKCINPAHLFQGTIADNIHDSVVKKRHICFRKDLLEIPDLDEKEIVEIINMVLKGFYRKRITEKFNISKNQIRAIMGSKKYRHLMPHYYR
jgi:Txe/YoeB family toxin of Txe-Axe toxin-antitoxin module